MALDAAAAAVEPLLGAGTARMVRESIHESVYFTNS
jgi:hypothetical protein